MVGVKGMKKRIRWNEETMEVILAARQQLEDEGWKRLTKRETLYRLLRLPNWTKKHYDTLCRKTGEWQDNGDIPFGLWEDDTGGNDYTPLTSREISRRLERLKNAIPARLADDGHLHAIFVEHSGMTYDVAEMVDHAAAVVSSQGQLRREHLHRVVSGWVKVAEELKAKGIKAIALVDYDKGGREIYETHRAWLRRIFGIPLTLYGVTAEQVRTARLPVHENHQIDGWASEYGHARLKRDLREAIGLEP